MKQKKTNTFKSKLSKKAKEFKPNFQSNSFQINNTKQNQQQMYTYMMNTVVDTNSQVKFQNNFKRLDSYKDLQLIRQQFSELSELNKNKLQKNQNEEFKFIVVMSNSMDDIHKSIKYGIWTSPKNTNEILKQMFKKKTDNPSLRIILFFKVKSAMQFCGCAELISNYIEEQQYNLWWERVEWKGLFNVQWHYVKNIQLKFLVPKGVVQTPLRYYESQKELNEEIGMQILSVFEQQEYNYEDSLFKMFCVMDRREDELITMRQKIKMNKIK